MKRNNDLVEWNVDHTRVHVMSGGKSKTLLEPYLNRLVLICGMSKSRKKWSIFRLKLKIDDKSQAKVGFAVRTKIKAMSCHAVSRNTMNENGIKLRVVHCISTGWMNRTLSAISASSERAPGRRIRCFMAYDWIVAGPRFWPVHIALHYTVFHTHYVDKYTLLAARSLNAWTRVKYPVHPSSLYNERVEISCHFRWHFLKFRQNGKSRNLFSRRNRRSERLFLAWVWHNDISTSRVPGFQQLFTVSAAMDAAHAIVLPTELITRSNQMQFPILRTSI